MILALIGCHADPATPSTSPTGDTSASPQTDPNAPHLSDLQASLFTPTCTGGLCHSARSAAGGLVLEDGQSWASLVGVRSSEIAGATLVVPGAAVNSYLVLKLEGAPGIEGLPMPIGDRLDPTSITPVRAWIDAGALDN